jgi:hypothetical protein
LNGHVFHVLHEGIDFFPEACDVKIVEDTLDVLAGVMAFRVADGNGRVADLGHRLELNINF